MIWLFLELRNVEIRIEFASRYELCPIHFQCVNECCMQTVVVSRCAYPRLARLVYCMRRSQAIVRLMEKILRFFSFVLHGPLFKMHGKVVWFHCGRQRNEWAYIIAKWIYAPALNALQWEYAIPHSERTKSSAQIGRLPSSSELAPLWLLIKHSNIVTEQVGLINPS